jgi:type IV pilus assembly protein PilW
VTLVELMVAMVISLIVLLAVSTVYFSTKRTYSVQQQYSKMQENALYAFQNMTQSVSMAGYAGCSVKLNNLLDLTTVDPALFDFKTGVYGWEYTGTAPGSTYAITSLTPPGTATNWDNYTNKPLDADIVKYAIPGSDVLVVISTQQLDLKPTGNVSSGSVNIPLSGTLNKPTDTIMVLSDCRQSDVFMNTVGGTNSLSVSTTCPQKGAHTVKPCNASANWSHTYNASDARLYASTSRAYFIGQGVNGDPALFRYDLDRGQPSTPQELVDGVENMQVLYGENVGGSTFSANHYVPIDKVTDPNKIYAVRISLLMRSGTVDRPAPTAAPNENLGAPNEAVVVQPQKDQRLRKVFTTTIALRNMAITGR